MSWARNAVGCKVGYLLFPCYWLGSHTGADTTGCACSTNGMGEEPLCKTELKNEPKKERTLWSKASQQLATGPCPGLSQMNPVHTVPPCLFWSKTSNSGFPTKFVKRAIEMNAWNKNGESLHNWMCGICFSTVTCSWQFRIHSILLFLETIKCAAKCWVCFGSSALIDGKSKSQF
jgi:hypothetical protein